MEFIRLKWPLYVLLVCIIYTVYTQYIHTQILLYTKPVPYLNCSIWSGLMSKVFNTEYLITQHIFQCCCCYLWICDVALEEMPWYKLGGGELSRHKNSFHKALNCSLLFHLGFFPTALKDIFPTTLNPYNIKSLRIPPFFMSLQIILSIFCRRVN